MSNLLTRLSNYLCGGHYEPRTTEEGEFAKQLIEYEKRYGWKDKHRGIPQGVWILAILKGETEARMGEVQGGYFYYVGRGADYWESTEKKCIIKWKEVDVSND